MSKTSPAKQTPGPIPITKDDARTMTVEIGAWKSTMYEQSSFEPYNPDDLVRKFGGNKGIDKYSKMKQDDAVKAALFVKKSAILSSGYRFVPASASPADKRVAQEISDDIAHGFVGNFEAALVRILSALDYGFSVNEKIFAVEGSRVVLKNLKLKPAQSFEFHLDDFGNLKEDGFKQWTSTKLIPLPPFKFVHFVNNSDVDGFYGESDLRAAYRSWFSKDVVIKAWNIYLERCGIPLTVARYSANASDEDIAALNDIGKNLSFKTHLTIPKDAEIDFKESTRNATGDFDVAIDKHNQMILRSILVPRHLGFDEAQGGSYALGKVNFGVFSWVANRIRNEMEEAINEQVVRHVALLNDPGIDAFPAFQFNPLTDEDKSEKAKAIVEALKNGVLQSDPVTENFLRGLLGLPEIAAEERAMSRRPAGRSFKYSRQPNRYEKKVDFDFAQGALVDDADAGIEDLKTQLKKIRDDFTNQVVRKKVVENKNVAALDGIEFRYIRELGLMMEGIIRGGYEKGGKFAKDAAKSADFAGPVSGQGLVKTKAVQWVKQQAKLLTGEISTALQGKAKKIVLDGIEKGLAPYDVVNKIDAVFEPYVALAGEEGAAIDGMRLYTEVNTAIAKAFRTGIDEYNSPLEAEGWIEAYEFSAILDDVTTDECEALDGKVFGANNPVWDKVNPPIWWNCRSLRVPVFQGEKWVEDDVPGIVYKSDKIFSAAGGGDGDRAKA